VAGRFRRSLPDAVTRIRTRGWARAIRRTTSRQAPCSVFSDRRNFFRTGTASKIRLTKRVVPGAPPASDTCRISPSWTTIRVPAGCDRVRVVISTRAMEAMLGRASPRNPKERTDQRSSNRSILLVA
jgi:hypothetical protein